MKARIKQFLASHSSLQLLVPVGQYVLGVPCKIRAVVFREILRFRLASLWLRKRQPLLLFVRFGGIGDILCSLPAYEAVCRANPLTHGVFITLTEFQCLPALVQAPGSVCSSRVHCSVPILPRWLVAQVFIPQYTDELGRQGSTDHLVDEFFCACGLAPTGAVLRFNPAPERLKKVRETFGLWPGGTTKTVVIHPGPSWKVKEWPVEYWQALVDGLRTSSDVRILQVGAHRHIAKNKAAATLFGVESLVGKLSLVEMATLLVATDLFIGIDSGMIHMAGAAGTPCVGLFGPTNPAHILHNPNAVGLSFPLPCSFCHHRQPRLHFQTGCPHDIACMKRLTPETVLAKCRELLATTTARTETA